MTAPNQRRRPIYSTFSTGQCFVWFVHDGTEAYLLMRLCLLVGSFLAQQGSLSQLFPDRCSCPLHGGGGGRITHTHATHTQIQGNCAFSVHCGTNLNTVLALLPRLEPVLLLSEIQNHILFFCFLIVQNGFRGKCTSHNLLETHKNLHPHKENSAKFPAARANRNTACLPPKGRQAWLPVSFKKIK